MKIVRGKKNHYKIQGPHSSVAENSNYGLLSLTDWFKS
jgi:hypothetical protein